MCQPSLGTSVPTVRTPKWSKLMGFYPSWRCYHTPKCATYVCVCLPSLPGVGSLSGFAEVGQTVLIRYYYHFFGAQFLCWPLSFGEDGKSPTYYRGGVAKCAEGIQNTNCSKGQNLTHSPAYEENQAEQRKNSTTVTNACTSLRRQGERSRTQSLPGWLTLTPTHATGRPWQVSHEPYWLLCQIASEHSAAGQLWPARNVLARFSDRAWRERCTVGAHSV